MSGARSFSITRSSCGVLRDTVESEPVHGPERQPRLKLPQGHNASNIVGMGGHGICATMTPRATKAFVEPVLVRCRAGGIRTRISGRLMESWLLPRESAWCRIPVYSHARGTVGLSRPPSARIGANSAVYHFYEKAFAASPIWPRIYPLHVVSTPFFRQASHAQRNRPIHQATQAQRGAFSVRFYASQSSKSLQTGSQRCTQRFASHLQNPCEAWKVALGKQLKNL